MKWILVFFLFVMACEKKSNLGLEVKYAIDISYKKPKEGCRQLAHVTGFSTRKLGFTESYKRSLNTIRREAHETGGNFLYIKRASSDGTSLDGISYNCSK